MREIAKVVKWEDVQKSHKYFFPTDKNNYKPIFEWLKKVPFEEQKRKGEYIKLVVASFREKILEDQEDQFYTMATNMYSLSFRKWSETASLPIGEETLKNHTLVDILAHYLWEITFYGSEDDMMETGDMIQGRVKEYKEEHDRSSKKSK
jgi:hypothetical protein